MDLHVGLVGEEPGWRAFLLREGIAWRQVIPPFKPSEHPILVLGAHASRDLLAPIRAYLNDGGAVLVSPAHAPALTGMRMRKMRVSYLVPSADPVFAGIDGIDLRCPIEIPDRANVLAMLNGEKAAFIGREGHGHILVLPFDVPAILEDGRSGDRSFPSPASRLPFEHVSVVAKGAVRMLALRSLELLFHRRGFPFVHLWYYPEGAQSVFFFRIDTDYGTPEEIESLSRLMQEEKIAATWFVHVGAQRGLLERYAAMPEQEIAVHCDQHRLMLDPNEARRDLENAMRTLRDAGLSPVGFAAPYGRWSPASEAAALGAGVEYSSEFSLAFDDIPLRPLSGTGMLQIPIHPICLGSLRRHRYSSEQSTKYFTQAVERLLARRLPVGLYHHPKDGHPEVLRDVFRHIRRSGIRNMSMMQFARWWKEREQARVTARFEQGTVAVAIEGGRAGLRARIVHPDGRERFVEHRARLELADASWELRAAANWTADDVRARAFNPRIPLIRGLDAVVRLVRKKERNA